MGSTFGPLNPTVTGAVASYSIAPSLPAGLVLNATTGVISGIPTLAAALASYIVTATNAGGSATFSLSIGVTAAIVMTASTTTPTALTPIALKVIGLDFTSAFSVQLVNSSGYSGTLAPVRTDASSGTVVVAAPFYINPATGTTGPLTALVQVTQGKLTSNAVALAIADLPSVASYGVNPGDISRGFYNAQAIYHGITVNALQAMRALPTSKTNITTVMAHQMAQQTSVTEARSNVDLIVSGKQTSLSVGKATNGAAINYDAHSVDIQDRVFALYLQAIGYLPTTIYSGTPALAKPVTPYYPRKSRRSSTPGAAISLGSLLYSTATFEGRVIGKSFPAIDSSTPTITAVPERSSHFARLAAAAAKPAISTPTAKQIIDGLGYLGGAVGIANAGIQTFTTKDAFDAVIAIGQGASTAALVIGAVVAAPELIAAATIVGTGFALAGLANDSYKWYTASNAVTAATDSGNAVALAAAQKDLSDAKTNVTIDAVGSVLGVFGFPAEVAGDLGIGAQVVNVLSTAQTGLSGVAVQGLSLLTSTEGLAVTLSGTAMSSDSKTMDSSNLEVPAASNSFGLVDGTVSVTDANGPILSPLSGAYLNFPSSGVDFTTLAGADDSYSLIVPLGIPGYNYMTPTLETYDPISMEATGTPIVLNLSQLTDTTPVNASTIKGTCVDMDAGAPDEDDPDCD